MRAIRQKADSLPFGASPSGMRWFHRRPRSLPASPAKLTVPETFPRRPGLTVLEGAKKVFKSRGANVGGPLLGSEGIRAPSTGI